MNKKNLDKKSNEKSSVCFDFTAFHWFKYITYLLNTCFNLSSELKANSSFISDDIIDNFIANYNLNIDKVSCLNKIVTKFKENYKYIKAYHGCRTFNVKRYYEKGVLRLNPDILIQQIQIKLKEFDK